MKQYYRVLNNKEIKELEFYYNIKLSENIFIGERTVFDDEEYIYIQAQGEKILIDVTNCIELDLNLSTSEETQLYNYMMQRLTELDKLEQCDIANIEEFSEIIEELRELYISYSETENFYNYIEDYIDYTILCNL